MHSQIIVTTIAPAIRINACKVSVNITARSPPKMTERNNVDYWQQTFLDHLWTLNL